MSAGLAASEPQSISSAAVKLNSDSVSSSSTANTGTPDSVVDPVSASTVATKRGRGQNRTKKANERSRAKNKAAKQAASRAIVRVSELHGQVRRLEGRTRELEEQVEIQRAITDSAVLSAVRGKLLDLQHSNHP